MKSVSNRSARKHFYLYAFTVVVASGAALGAACSSSTDSGTSGGTADSGSDSKGSSGTSGVVNDTGTVGAQDKDTCKGAATGNSCQCSCAITGQKEDKTLHCLQPAQDTGECPKLCCTGEVDSGGSSSGTIVDAGDAG